jgi:antitoxin component of MazEF toxin-antitoxin module
MSQRPQDEHHIRKLTKTGMRGATLSVTIPIAIVNKLRLRDGQKVTFSTLGNKIIIEDWKP